MKLKSIIVPALFILGLNILVFAKTLSFGFVWDDNVSHLRSNPALMGNRPKEFWKKTYDGLYIPLSYTIWTFLAHTDLAKSDSKDEVFKAMPFHFLNFSFHILNSILVLLLLFAFCGNNVAAFMGAAIFAVHPMQVESVAWISEFRGLLCAFFFFSALDRKSTRLNSSHRT